LVFTQILSASSFQKGPDTPPSPRSGRLMMTHVKSSPPYAPVSRAERVEAEHRPDHVYPVTAAAARRDQDVLERTARYRDVIADRPEPHVLLVLHAERVVTNRRRVDATGDHELPHQLAGALQLRQAGEPATRCPASAWSKVSMPHLSAQTSSGGRMSGRLTNRLSDVVVGTVCVV
jgi:hypothetical protein